MKKMKRSYEVAKLALEEIYSQYDHFSVELVFSERNFNLERRVRREFTKISVYGIWPGFYGIQDAVQGKAIIDSKGLFKHLWRNPGQEIQFLLVEKVIIVAGSAKDKLKVVAYPLSKKQNEVFRNL